MGDTKADLSRLTSAIERIRKEGAVLGLSVGVIQKGQIIYTVHLGQKQLVKPNPPNDDTIYYLASLTKAVTAAAAAILVEQGVLDWNVPVAKCLPEWAMRKDDIGQEATLVDLLCHRTGLPSMSPFWVQRQQRFMLPKAEVLKAIVNFRAATPFRHGFRYCNWGYSVVESVIEHATGQSYSNFVREHIFAPLKLHRTMIEIPNDANVTSSNTNWNNGSICPLKMPPQSDQTGLAAAGAMKSSLSDLLQLYQAFLSAYTAERQNCQSNRPFNSESLKLVSKLFEPRVPIGDSTSLDHSYALGWVQSILPHRLGTMSMNTIYMDDSDMPIIGSETPGVRVLHHHGSLLGGMSNVHLIPETETAIVVLANTFGCSDVADWIGQLVLQTILGDTPHDYVDWIRKSKSSLEQKYADATAELAVGKTEEPPSQDLHAYCGRYMNTVRNFVLEFTELSDVRGLRMKVQDFDDVLYDLFPYGGDVFYWPCDREMEMCKEIMFPWTRVGIHKLVFSVKDDGFVDRVEWELDPSVGMEVFFRT